MQNNQSFPLQGVIGIVANSAEEVEKAVVSKLHCVEIRADLLLDSGVSRDGLMVVVRQAKTSGLAVLFTLRHPTHGGSFNGSEEERAAISEQALDSGADLVDLEWNTNAATLLQHKRNQLLLSYHDFDGMPDQQTLINLTATMCESHPRAIKIVPTAASLDDAVRMLQWARTPDDSAIRRIGFAMGPLGACSRILTIAFGAPITYASFGQAVAPGQVDMDALLHTYRAMDLNASTEIVAVIGDSGAVISRVFDLNQQYWDTGKNTVAIALPDAPDLQAHTETLRIKDVLI